MATEKKINENGIPLKPNGEPYKILDAKLRFELDKQKVQVQKYGWDYVAVVAGLPGSGKSTLARGLAKFCDPSFDIDRIVFTAQDFIDATTTAEPYSAIVYDECFEGMNTKATLGPEFQKIINHLQLIRKKNLFIFLCLPNFFDLSKGIAVFRSEHLFLTYSSNEGKRGYVLAFGRNAKRKLYVEGRQYMNYNAIQANFRCRFTRNNWIIDEDLYEKKKDTVLEQYAKKLDEKTKKKPDKVDVALMNWVAKGKPITDFAKLYDLNYETAKKRVQYYRERKWLPEKSYIKSPKTTKGPLETEEGKREAGIE